VKLWNCGIVELCVNKAKLEMKSSDSFLKIVLLFSYLITFVKDVLLWRSRSE
jgi:hypothetical protein